jgi:catechol 2,3-dioxygenase-like lactoylglutathione lyase family enzyme
MSDAATSILALRPFIPAKDFAASQRFYAELGFRIRPLGDDLAEATLGQHSFLLQNFYEEKLASNFMMHLLVSDIDEWWNRIKALNLVDKYAVRKPRPPKDEPWGLTVLYLFDPSGVLWHIAQPTRTAQG